MTLFRWLVEASLASTPLADEDVLAWELQQQSVYTTVTAEAAKQNRLTERMWKYFDVTLLTSADYNEYLFSTTTCMTNDSQSNILQFSQCIAIY